MIQLKLTEKIYLEVECYSWDLALPSLAEAAIDMLVWLI